MRARRTTLVGGALALVVGVLVVGCAAEPAGPPLVVRTVGPGPRSTDPDAPRFTACGRSAADPATTDLRPRDLSAADRDLARAHYGDLPEGALVVESATTLLLTDGLLGAGNGYEAATAQVRPVPVADGTVSAPVSLLVLDSPDAGRRVAFVEVRLGDGPVVRWDEEPRLAIGTDGGDGGFVATGTAPSLDPESAALTNAPYDAIDAFFPDGDSSSGNVCVLRSSGGTVDAVSFATGWGDGWYGTFLGRDASGTVVAVVHDGHIVPWEISGLPGAVPEGLAADAPVDDGQG